MYDDDDDHDDDDDDHDHDRQRSDNAHRSGKARHIPRQLVHLITITGSPKLSNDNNNNNNYSL